MPKMLPKFWLRVSQNWDMFAQILISCFAKFEVNFARHEIEIFAKISQNNENEFRSHPTPNPLLNSIIANLSCAENFTLHVLLNKFYVEKSTLPLK